MELCRILTTIIVASLIKSGSADFSLVEPQGGCQDSSGNFYDIVQSEPWTIDNLSDAIDWCLTATAYASSLVAVEYGNGYWYCSYDNGSIDDIQLVDFSPAGTWKSLSFSGTGAVGGTGNNPPYTCYKNEVRSIDSSCIVSFIFSHNVPTILPYSEFWSDPFPIYLSDILALHFTNLIASWI
jgi:hypothetical protein